MAVLHLVVSAESSFLMSGKCNSNSSAEAILVVSTVVGKVFMNDPSSDLFPCSPSYPPPSPSVHLTCRNTDVCCRRMLGQMRTVG